LLRPLVTGELHLRVELREALRHLLPGVVADGEQEDSSPMPLDQHGSARKTEGLRESHSLTFPVHEKLGFTRSDLQERYIERYRLYRDLSIGPPDHRTKPDRDPRAPCYWDSR
jgi:hypothetical protein